MRCRNSDAFASWKLVAAWLSNAPLQASAAPGRGGIAGVLRADGSPAFLYGEITGYWLRWASFYAPNRARMTTALAFITDQWSGDEPAATRLGAAADWRNRGVFSFDLAMMLRGIADARPVVGDAASTEAAATLQPWLERLTDAAGGLRPCLAWPGATLPPSWSTRPGPYQCKTAAALLQVPQEWLPAAVVAAARHTLETWRGRAAEHSQMHARLYALEGEWSAGHAPDLTPLLGPLRRGAALPETLGETGSRGRADVQAQALRLLCLAPDAPAALLDSIAARLTMHVGPDGSLRFRRGDKVANVWCGLFAHQALDWLLRRRNRDTLPQSLAASII